jgi:hypothetical protein
MTSITNPHLGSDFEEFLADEGLLEGANSLAVKRVLEWQVEQLKCKSRNDSKID